MGKKKKKPGKETRSSHLRMTSIPFWKVVSINHNFQHTIWHYLGGCQIGRVVDKGYRVLGIDSLKVIDGSTFYHTRGANPQAIVMRLGRYMGQRILHDRLVHGSKKKN